MCEISDEELAMRFREGDEQAYNRLYSRHWRTTVIEAYTVVQCAEDAEEVAQEVWMKYYIFPVWDGSRGKFKPWIATCTRNKAKDRWRSKNRHATSHSDDFEALAGPDPHDIVEDVADALDRAVIRSVIRRCMYRLSLMHRRILIYKYYQDLSIKEIAHYLSDLEGREVRIGTVNSRLNRARNLLQECVEKHIGRHALRGDSHDELRGTVSDTRRSVA